MEVLRRTGLIHSQAYQDHATPEGHPESPSRTEAVLRALRERGLFDRLHPIEPTPATRAEIQRVHTPAYLAQVDADFAEGRPELSTGDTQISPQSKSVAALAAGGVLRAVDAVVAGTVRNAFCVVRPPGHHATPSRGMGFCLHNNIAIAARHAQARHGIGKVLIADWDVHHGNGTQDVFWEDGSVLFFDTHQHPWYPGTGEADEKGSGRGLNCVINCPFPAGAGAKEILPAWEQRLVEAANTFKPEMIFLSAGFDSRLGDPLGLFRLTDDDFASMTRVLTHLAKEHAESRLVAVLEGGYSLKGLANGVCSTIQVMMGEK